MALPSFFTHAPRARRRPPGSARRCVAWARPPPARRRGASASSAGGARASAAESPSEARGPARGTHASGVCGSPIGRPKWASSAPPPSRRHRRLSPPGRPAICTSQYIITVSLQSTHQEVTSTCLNTILFHVYQTKAMFNHVCVNTQHHSVFVFFCINMKNPLPTKSCNRSPTVHFTVSQTAVSLSTVQLC